jgi:hypothetical protein
MQSKKRNWINLNRNTTEKVLNSLMTKREKIKEGKILLHSTKTDYLNLN